MRRYPSFAFDDYPTYLAAVEDLLKTRTAQGMHTTLTLFDPQEYDAYCSQAHLNPDSPASRSRFTAETAPIGPTLLYDGEPLTGVLSDLINGAARQATWEYSSTLLARLGDCASCGTDLGRDAFARATTLLTRILDTATPGQHHLVCHIRAAQESLITDLQADTETHGVVQLDENEALEFTTVLALGLAARPGALIVRTATPNTPDRVYGWRLHAGIPEPLTPAEVFDGYCTDIENGDPIPPEPDVDYNAPPELGPHHPTPQHHH
ncbi:hypothetical protein [Streptomyces sp. NBC_01304]|uniref:hypothetical protein n=1 Tax=Streptomyces sp. NBC_01304 TaxID=2903818 RepID=UPI002E111E80|nr:hypothetical protein OG430_41080 [Streptomyces sp. NBC_01304]